VVVEVLELMLVVLVVLVVISLEPHPYLVLQQLPFKLALVEEMELITGYHKVQVREVLQELHHSLVQH
tara:strand:- start:299 stop:502 length:204 start_codon:yes stop_codon:yes gene_type:complete